MQSRCRQRLYRRTSNAALQVGFGRIVSALVSNVSTYYSATSRAEGITRDAAEGAAKHGIGLFLGMAMQRKRRP